MFIYQRYLELIEKKNYEEAKVILEDLMNQYPYKIKYIEACFSFVQQYDSLPLEECKRILDILPKLYIRATSRQKMKRVSEAEKEAFLNDIATYSKTIDNKIEARKREILAAKKSDNRDILDILEAKLKELEDVQDKDLFDRILIEVKETENHLYRSRLEEEDELRYNRLIDTYSERITYLSSYFNNIDLGEYNQQALRDFKFLLDSFRKNKRKFRKHYEHLEALMSKKLFIYDVNKLYKEVLEFYNFTYNYIFNRLDLDNRYNMAKLALDTPKIWKKSK